MDVTHYPRIAYLLTYASTLCEHSHKQVRACLQENLFTHVLTHACLRVRKNLKQRKKRSTVAFLQFIKRHSLDNRKVSTKKLSRKKQKGKFQPKSKRQRFKFTKCWSTLKWSRAAQKVHPTAAKRYGKEFVSEKRASKNVKAIVKLIHVFFLIIPCCRRMRFEFASPQM